MRQVVETRQPDRIEPPTNAPPSVGWFKPPLLKRIINWWQAHLAAKRIGLVRRGWSRLWFYSFELAFDYLRAFWRLSPQLGLKESAQWTTIGVRLARNDADLADEFFNSSADAVLDLPAAVRERLFALNTNLPQLFSTKTAWERLRLALTIATKTADEELARRILDVALSISRSSLGYSRDFLRQAAEVVSHYNPTNSQQRTLFVRALALTEHISAQFAIKLFEAVAPLISSARSEGAEAHTSQLCVRLIEQTESLLALGHTGSFNFFLCGLELLRPESEEVIDRWAEFCARIARTELREFAVFTERAVEPTKALVSVALARGEAGRLLVGSVLEHAIALIERSLTAAINCYLTSPTLLRQLSLASYEAWVAHGLASFPDAERLAAYFSAETRASQIALAETADVLRLEEVAPVLVNYVEMLTGKSLPLVPRPQQQYDVLEPDTGQAIGLPPAINGLRDNQERFRLYKALAAQAAGQIEFGTYETGTEELRTLGGELQQEFPHLTPVQLNGNTDWLTLVTLFPLTTLVRRLFTILENARIEHQLRLRYRGLRGDLDLARRERRRSRPSDQYLVKYENLLDLLFKEVLGAGVRDEDTKDEEQRAWLTKVREIMAARIYTETASVTDTIRACRDLYEYLNPEPPENSLPWRDPHTRPEREEPNKQPPQREQPAHEANGQPATGNPDEQPASVVTASGVEPAFLSFASTAARGGELDDQHDPNTFYYDEWDCRIGDYRAHWCRVIERDWKQGDLKFARKTRAAYRGVLSQVRYQFQLLRPTGLRRVRGQMDGDDFDLEAVIDHVVDRHAHVTPSERIYSKRLRRDRDVAVCFLIDLSSSTFNQIGKDKRIIDLEKEALLLMSEALEAVGDAYAIYGFSSHGRHNVSFYRFKNFAEAYGERVERRIGAAISLTNTRLGAAIRHATWRLNEQPSATRLLIILSDARPADDEYVNARYAREDTRVALAEARASGATPFCIVIKQFGEAEPAEMLAGTGYTLIDDIHSLPERLPGIYRRLTT